MIWVRGQQYGTAEQIAATLGDDISVHMIRNWSQRDGLARYRVGRTVYYDLAQAATIERDKRLAERGRPRQLDITLVAA